jgi:anti-anti-sigma regulatory factor
LFDKQSGASATGGVEMLRITVIDTPTEQRWVLQGRLTEPWVSEVRSNWKNSRDARRGKTSVVDLNDVTFVDNAGERLLQALMRMGVACIARGVYVKAVMEELRGRRLRGE